jgi:hypothetical protein
MNEIKEIYCECDEEEEFDDYDEMMEEEEEDEGEEFVVDATGNGIIGSIAPSFLEDLVVQDTPKREYDENGIRVVRLKCCGVKFRKEKCICPPRPPKSDENACCMCKKTYKKDDEEDDYCYCDDCDELSVRQNIIDDENKRMPLLDKLIWLGEKMKDPFFTD